MLSREQILAGIAQMERRGAKPPEVQAWLDSLKPEEEPGFVQGVVRGVVNPVARLAYTGYKAIGGLQEAARAATGQESWDEAGRRTQDLKSKSLNLPYLGKIKALGETGSFAGDAADAAGVGVEIGSSLLGGGEGVQLSKMGLREGAQALFRGGIKKTAGRGFLVAGAPSAVGSIRRDVAEGSDAATTAGNAALAAGVGTISAPLIEGGLGLFGGLLRKTGVLGRGTREAAEDVSRGIKPPSGPGGGVGSSDTFIGRNVRRVQSALEERAALKAQPQPVQYAAKVGLDEPVRNFVANDLNPAEKMLAERVVDSASRGTKNLLAQGKHKELIGQPIVGIIRDNEKYAAKAGQQVGQAVKAMKSPVPVSDAIAYLNEKLTSLGIKVGEKGKLDFSGSQFRTVFNKGDAKLLQHVFDELNPNGNAVTVMDPWKAHTLRQSLFEDLEKGKADRELTGEAEIIADKIRSIMLGAMEKSQGSAGKLYRSSSEQYARTERALVDMFATLGKKWTGKSDQELGVRGAEVMGRQFGNASADV